MTTKDKSIRRRYIDATVQQTREPDLPLVFAKQRAALSAVPNSDAASRMDEPASGSSVSTWNVRIPVFQWEIDPTDTERRCGSAELKYLGWNFRMWWERHPTGLVYASIQATHGSRERDWQGGWTTPPGRVLAVNLVYDEQRQGIVSIHGDARNLHPFVEAFLMGFGIGPSF